MNEELAGYRELVDFGEHIGIWKNKEKQLALPTTKGIIHYSKNGAHIVPAYPGNAQIDITASSMRCCLQVALLGAITPNLRAVSVCIEQNPLIKIYFFFEFPPSEDEEELSEVVSTEVLADYLEISTKVIRLVVPVDTKIPEIGFCVFHRAEK